MRNPHVVKNIMADFMKDVKQLLKDPRTPTNKADLYKRSFPFRVKLCNEGFTMTEAEKMCREATEGVPA